jgi:ribulose-phosphate 3-epimerase
MDHNILASILAANFAVLGEESQNVLAAGADKIHFDVMDNHFVNNLTIGPMVCKSLRDYGIRAEIDVHLMTSSVTSLIASFAAAGASAITIHPEADIDLECSIAAIKAAGCAAGIAINPTTPLTKIENVLPEIDSVLLMSVEPGFGGQQFLPASYTKISELKAILVRQQLSCKIVVDGGVNIDNAAKIIASGADDLVIGSWLFNHSSYAEAIAKIRNAISN